MSFDVICAAHQSPRYNWNIVKTGIYTPLPRLVLDIYVVNEDFTMATYMKTSHWYGLIYQVYGITKFLLRLTFTAIVYDVISWPVVRINNWTYTYTCMYIYTYMLIQAGKWITMVFSRCLIRV